MVTLILRKSDFRHHVLEQCDIGFKYNEAAVEDAARAAIRYSGQSGAFGWMAIEEMVQIV